MATPDHKDVAHGLGIVGHSSAVSSPLSSDKFAYLILGSAPSDNQRNGN